MNRNIAEATKAAPILCQVILQVVFNPYNPAVSPSILTHGVGLTNLPARAGASHTAHMLTETSASDTATPESIGSGKIKLNGAQPTEGPVAAHILPIETDGDATSASSSR